MNYGCISPGTVLEVPNLTFRFPPDSPGFETKKGRPMNPSKRYRPTKSEVAAAETALRTLESRMDDLAKDNSTLRQDNSTLGLQIANIAAAADKDTQLLYDLTRNLAHAKGLLATVVRSTSGPERELIRRFLDIPPFDRNVARSQALAAADAARGTGHDFKGIPYLPQHLGGAIGT